MKTTPLTHIVSWSHSLLAEVLKPGDTAVDLTAGTGRDTLFLWQHVAPSGHVVAFDVQTEALEKSRTLLLQAGAPVFLHDSGAHCDWSCCGVHLVRDSHAHCSSYEIRPPQAVVANLGYLPGGDRTCITRSESTLVALDSALKILDVGGRLAVVAYPGHDGGRAEASAVASLLAGLDAIDWQVLHLGAANCPQAPLLWVAQKK